MSMPRGILFSVMFGIAVLGLIGFSGILEQQAFARHGPAYDSIDISKHTTLHFSKVINDDVRMVIEDNVTLTVEEGVTLSLSDEGFLTIYGSIINNGIINNNHSITMYGGSTIVNNGVINNNGDLYMAEYGKIINNGIINHSKGILSLHESDVIENNGEIYNYGPIDLGGTIYNTGLISNHNYIYSSFYHIRLETRHEGNIVNSGTIQNEWEIFIGEKGLKNDITGTITNISGATIHLKNGGLLDNEGTISNVFGTIQNDEGVIYNGGIIDNLGGTIENVDGKLNNVNILNNIGTLMVYSGGTFENNGESINEGTFDNGGVSKNNGIFNNRGLLINDRIFNNVGTLTNFCDGVIQGLSKINNNPVEDACILDNTLEIVPESATNPKYDDNTVLNDPFVKFKGSGPLAFALYNFDDDVLDSSGNANHGTVSGTTTFTAGKDGNAFDFDGSSFVTLANPNNFDFDVSDSFSISFWMKKPSDPDFNIVISKNASLYRTTIGWELFTTVNDKIHFKMADGSNPIQGRLETPVNDDTWHHVVAVWSGGTDESAMTFYVDGVLGSTLDQTNNIITTISNTDSVVIGADSNDNNKFNGQMDNVRIYDVALTEAQVAGLHSPPSNVWSTFGQVSELAITTGGFGSNPSDTTIGYVSGLIKTNSGGIPLEKTDALPILRGEIFNKLNENLKGRDPVFIGNLANDLIQIKKLPEKLSDESSKKWVGTMLSFPDYVHPKVGMEMVDRIKILEDKEENVDRYVDGIQKSLLPSPKMKLLYSNFIQEKNQLEMMITQQGSLVDLPTIPTPKMFQPPGAQIKNGLMSDEIICNSGFIKMEKITDEQTLCVKEISVDKFIDRGVAKFIE